MELFRYHIYIAIVLTSSIGLTTRICLAQETAGQETRGVNGVKKSGEKSRRHAISSVNIMMEKAMLIYTLWDILDIYSFYDASPTQQPDTSEHSISKMQEQDVISLHNSARQKTTPKLPLKPRTGMVRKEVFTSKGLDQVSSAYKTLSDPTATTNTVVPFMQHTLKSFYVFTGSQFPPKASTREAEHLEVTKSIDISVKSTSDLSLHTEVNSVNSSNSLLPPNHLWDSTIKTRTLDRTASKILITPSTVQRAKNILVSTQMSNEPILDDHASVVEISLRSTSSDNSLTKSTYPTPVSEIQDKYVHYTITRENSTHNLSAKALKMSTKMSKLFSTITSRLPETLSVSKKDILAKWASRQSHWSDSKTLSASEQTSMKQRAHNIDLHSNSLFSVSTTSRPPPNLLNVPQTPSFKVSPSLVKTIRKEQTTSSNNKRKVQLVTQTTETKRMIFSSLSLNKRCTTPNTMSEIYDTSVNTTNTTGNSRLYRKFISKLHHVTRVNPTHIRSSTPTHTTISVPHPNDFHNNLRQSTNASTLFYSVVNKTVQKQHKPMLRTVVKKTEVFLPKNVTEHHRFTSLFESSREITITADVNNEKLTHVQLLSVQNKPSRGTLSQKKVTERQMLYPDDLHIQTLEMPQKETKEASFITRNPDTNSTKKTVSYSLINSTLKMHALPPPNISYSTELTTQDVGQRSPKPANYHQQFTSLPMSSGTITSRLQTEASVLKGLMKLTESDILASTGGATRSPPANTVAKHLIAVPVTRPTSTQTLFRIDNIQDAQNIMHTSTTEDEKSNVTEHLRSELFTTPYTSSGDTTTASIRQQPQSIHSTPSTMSQKDLIPGDLSITDQTLPQKKSAQPVLTSRNTNRMSITSGHALKVIPEEQKPSNMTTFLPETLSVSKKDILAKWASTQSDSKTPKTLSASEKTSMKQRAHNIDLHSNSLFSVSTTSRPMISEGVYTEASKISESPVLLVFALGLLVMLIFSVWKIWQYQTRKNDIWVAGFPLKEGTYEALLWTKKGTKRLEGLSIENECHEV